MTTVALVTSTLFKRKLNDCITLGTLHIVLRYQTTLPVSTFSLVPFRAALIAHFSQTSITARISSIKAAFWFGNKFIAVRIAALFDVIFSFSSDEMLKRMLVNILKKLVITTGAPYFIVREHGITVCVSTFDLNVPPASYAKLIDIGVKVPTSASVAIMMSAEISANEEILIFDIFTDNT